MLLMDNVSGVKCRMLKEKTNGDIAGISDVNNGGLPDKNQ